MPPGHSRERIHLKFREGTAVRLRGNQLISLRSDDLSGLRTVLNRHSGVRVERLFTRPEADLDREKATIEAQSRRQQADLNLYYRLVAPAGVNTDALLNELNALPIVEIAYAEPLAQPTPASPNFENQQGYLNAATGGADARFSWTQAAGRGSNVKIADVEYSWNQTHEDLSKAGAALVANGTPQDPFDDNNHGTAVLGEMISDNNGFGVTGIASDAGLILVNADNVERGYDLANSINTAAANLGAGDVMIIEQQTAGPNGCNNGVSGCVAVEWVQAFYDAIVAATSSGITVVEPAGNGNENLDDINLYGSPFPAGRPDSGAIIVGAGAAPGCTNPMNGRLGFSTYGSRVDVHGWGECVVTTGYGDLQGGSTRNVWYTSRFSGTSSASPIVAGAAAALSSVFQQVVGKKPTSTALRERLRDTGTPQDTSGLAGKIGPLPNLKAALGPLQAIRPGLNATNYGPNDDGTYPCTGLNAGTPFGCTPTTVPLGFTINFFGQNYSAVYVNNNGNLTFDSPLSDFTPFPILTTNHVIIAPFFSDVDTRMGPTVYFGTGTVNARPAFGVTWPGIGCFAQNTRVTNVFQVVLINRDDTGTGNFDVEFNEGQIQWEAGQASGGNTNCVGGAAARVGYSNGTNTSFEMPGSGVDGYFLDSNTATGLIYGSRNALEPGRYVFPVRNGIAPTGATLTGHVFGGDTSNPLANALVSACAGGFCNTTRTGATGLFSFGGLTAGSYTLSAFPPSITSFDPANLTVSVPASGTVTQDIILTGPTAPPTGTTITNIGAYSNGVPIVYWGQPLALTTQGCAGGSAGYQLLQNGTAIRSGAMAEGPAGTYTATIAPLIPNHGDAVVAISLTCPGGGTQTIQFNVYIDPSGTVRTTAGAPISGATVTLYRSDGSSGPFTQVPDGDSIMAPSNRRNPDITDVNGKFGWDVFAGYYVVRAQKSGCTAPGNPAQAFVESGVLTIPPPVTNLDLLLDCAVANVAPVVALPVTGSADEGTPYTASGSFSDPDSTSWTATVDYGDGSGVQALALTGTSFSLSHIYGDNGVYTVTVTVTDDAGAHGGGASTVTVNNVPPTATFNAPASVNEGRPVLISLTNPVDVPPDLPTLQYAFDCGDGAGYTVSSSNNSTSCPTADNGSRAVKGKVKDKDGGVTEYTATVTILNVPPAVSNDRASQTVQYSDPITAVAITATDVAADMPGLMVVTSFKTDAGSFQVGLPTGLTLTPGGSTGIWSLAGKVLVAPGAYTVRITATDKDGGAGSTDVGITLTAEDARVTYTGALFASTASVTSSAATVTLSATVQDITAVTGDPAFDPDAGDIRNATVTFADRDHANAVLCTAPIGLVSPTDLKTGTATCNWAANLGTQDSASYTIGVVIGGFYTRNSSADDAVVTVAKPLATNFITGGGTLLNQTSAGLVPGTAGQKTNFGFNVKYNKAGTNLQGQVNVILRNGARTYQIKSNLLTSLAANSGTGTAAFNGKASIQDITDPLNPISVDGNASLQLTLTDNGEPGSTDTIGITLWNKSGGLWFASAWDSTKTIQQVLSGGNLVVR